MALLVIVGGGVGGVAAALAAATAGWNRARGNEIVLLREPDEPLPRSEALTSLAWWHSGLHYARRVDADLDFAAQLGTMARLTQQRLQLDLQQVPPGVMRVPQRGLALFFLAVQQLGIRSLVRKLPVAEARHLLGPAHRPGPEASYFEVPDRPFAEADLLVVLRQHARAHGVHLREVADGAHLVPDGAAPCRCKVVAGGLELEPDAMILAAGCGTPALLEQLGVERATHQLVLDRITMLVVTRPVFAASLIADYGAGWAATQLERGRYVFTTASSRDEDVPLREARYVAREHVARLREYFEEVTGCSIAGNHRAITSLELRRLGAPEPAHARAVIERAPRGYPGVLWMLPGRAPMALLAAQHAVADLPRPTRAHAALSALPGQPWQGPVAMAHSRYYERGQATGAGA